ncbi:hypothetical protein L596_022512 [Steinernema carpocapsae]|uniref:Uncharacterized protein n=1 Tax=Steinernema carpocapsae TaxID=34508 RepID=A0A4U5MLV8_STECR|nr:hypothetical protein L596_022512 [Steinernema carpocapsae]
MSADADFAVSEFFSSSEFRTELIEPKNTRNCRQFGVCGSNLGAVAVAKPTGHRRRRNACKRKSLRYHNPLIDSIRQLVSGNFATDEHTDTSRSFCFLYIKDA